MMNEDLRNTTKQMLDVNQKPEDFKIVLHNQWLKEQNLKEDFKNFIKNEKDIMDKVVKDSPKSKEGLEEVYNSVKERLKGIDVNSPSLSLDEVYKLNTIKNDIEKQYNGFNLSIITKDYKEPVLRDIKVNEFRENAKLNQKIEFLKENNETILTFAKELNNKDDKKVREIKDTIDKLGFEIKLIDESKNIVSCQIKDHNIFYTNNNPTNEFKFMADKNVPFDKLSREDKERYSMEAKMTNNLLKQQLEGDISKEGVVSRINQYFYDYGKNYNRKLIKDTTRDTFEFAKGDERYDKNVQIMIGTLDPFEREKLSNYIKENNLNLVEENKISSLEMK